jgi:carboxypeptidase family protein
VRARLMHIVLAVGCVGLLPAAVFGQGAIGGVVRDSSGGVLPGVTVEATSPALIERVRTAVTDNNGQYLIVDLRPGVYSVAFTLTGFTTLKREGLELSTGVTLPINAELKVGAIEETVIVTSQTPVVDIKSTRQQTVLTRDLLDVIPRTRLQQLTATLLPGVVLQGAADVGGATSEPVTNLSIHGGDHNDQIWAIDGMKITEGGAGARRILIVADNTVQEYTYETSAFPAEIPTGGIRMNLVPKEGGNRFKGIVSGDFTTRGMVSNNLSAKLKDRVSVFSVLEPLAA